MKVDPKFRHILSPGMKITQDLLDCSATSGRMAVLHLASNDGFAAGKDAIRPLGEEGQPGTIQWLNPNAFVSPVDPATGTCNGGNSTQTCQFGNLGRNALRGSNFFWSDYYITKWFPLTERVKLRFDAQFFNVFNHPNFALPSMVLAGVPGKPSTQTGFGALTSTTSPPTGLLGVGLGGDSSPRMIAFQARLQF